MKAYITIEQTLTRQFAFEYDRPEDLEAAAEAFFQHIQETPEEMENHDVTWDYCVNDEDEREVIPWGL